MIPLAKENNALVRYQRETIADRNREGSAGTLANDIALDQAGEPHYGVEWFILAGTYLAASRFHPTVMVGSREAIRVLHIDDEADFASMAADFLEREDDRFEVVTESSTADGLQRLR